MAFNWNICVFHFFHPLAAYICKITRNPYKWTGHNADCLMPAHQCLKWHMSLCNYISNRWPSLLHLRTLPFYLHIEMYLSIKMCNVVGYLDKYQNSQQKWYRHCVQKLWAKSISGFNDVIPHRNDRVAKGRHTLSVLFCCRY